jgi:hypothetical protein
MAAGARMNLLLDRHARQQLAQRQFDGELLMEEFLGPARCTVCGQPKIIVETAKIPQLEAEKVCTDCRTEVAQYSSRYNLSIHRAMYELRNRHIHHGAAHGEAVPA